MAIPTFVRKSYPAPLTLQAALDILNASDCVTASSKAALKSAALDGVRYAQRSGDQLPSKAEALTTDIRPLLAILPAAARVAAVAKNHRSPGDHAARARRFVEILTGGRAVDRSRLRTACPPEWQPLVDAIPDRKNANGEMAFLHRCCVVAGYQDAPARMPSYEELVEAARHIDGEKAVRRLTQSAMPQYRTARQRLIHGASTEDERAAVVSTFGILPTAASSRTCHLGVESETLRLVAAAGGVPVGMSPEEMFRVVAPGLAADYDYWVAGPGSQRSDSFRGQCLASLLRVAGWVVRAGHGARLRDLELLDLFLSEVAVEDPTTLNPRLARRLGREAGDTSAAVSLLEFAAEAEAEASLRRSTVTDIAVVGRAPNGRHWFTEAIHANCSRLWTMTKDVYGEMGSQGGKPATTWALVESRWGRLQRQLSERKIPAQHRVRAKNKLKMVQTVTLPQLVCVGLPLRRREVHALRDEWLAVVRMAADARHSDPFLHPEAVAAERRYFNAAFPFTLVSLAIDDGLRLKQYTRGRLGDNANFRVGLERDATGVPIGVKTLTTHWTGDRRDSAHLKIREKKNVVTRREGRLVRRGYVDHVVLADLILYWRPRQLVLNGAFASLEAYDLEADLRAGEYALFPSDQDVLRPEKSRTDLSSLFGRELHYIVRTWLRPGLPAWRDLDDTWRGLWAIHISRLLIGSYWGGARGDWRTAMYLTMDTEETLRGDYSEIDDGLRDRLGLDRTNWEHLNAYDPWMDRLYHNGEEFDPLEDPSLPLPPHLQGRIPKAARALPKKRRIRRARPGQKPPLSLTVFQPHMVPAAAVLRPEPRRLG